MPDALREDEPLIRAHGVGFAHGEMHSDQPCTRRKTVFLLLLLFLPPLQTQSRAAGAPVPRVISLYAAHTEVLLRLGARDNIIGVSRQESYDGPETDGWEPATFSFRDDVEAFLAADPDIVLARPQHIAGNPRMKEALEQAGIRVAAMQVTRAADLYGYWRELAALVGREKEAEAMIARFEEGVAPYRRTAEARSNPPGVFVESIHREVKTFTPDSIPMWLISLAGGRNAAADAEPASPGVVIAEYGPERLLAKADEVEIFVSQEGAMNRTTLSVLRERGIYQPLAAFKRGRVYKIPEAVLSRPTPSLLEGVRLLASWTGLDVEEGAADDH